MTTSATPPRPAPDRPRRAVLGGAACLVAGAALVAALPGVAGAVTPPPPPLPSGVEDLQPYIGQEGCDPVAKPGVLAFQSLLMSTYRDTGSLGIVRDCGIGGSSEHKEGRAFDWAVSVNNANHVAEVRTVTDWLTGYAGRDFASNARRFGIMYMIWNHRIWKAYQPEAGWQDYTGPDPHTNHVHFSFGWNGAKRNTSWWSGRVAPLDYGPYSTERPPAPTPPPPPPGTPNRSDIDAKHDAMGGDGGILGPATGNEVAVLGGRYRPYANGAIYSSPSAGVHEVHGEIAARYLAMGGSRSPMGLPTSDEGNVPGGRGNSFADGQVLWSGPTGARAVYGLIGARYRTLGGPAGVLGLPRGDEVDVPGGRSMDFAGGQVLWSGPTGAHEVYGVIEAKYGALGDAAGVMGLPTTGEVPIATGRVNVFQGGNIYWSGPTGAHEVHGEIKAAYVNAGGANLWGLPVTDELVEPGGGRSNAFLRARVYWSGTYGAHLVRGYIGDRYVADGAAPRYGLPVGDEYATPTGRSQDFERAAIDFDAATLGVTVRPR